MARQIVRRIICTDFHKHSDLKFIAMDMEIK